MIADGSTDMLKLVEKGQLTARVLEGDDFLNLRPANRVSKVGVLLGPLTVKDVPIIRGVGLNYKAHSKSLLRLLRLLPSVPSDIFSFQSFGDRASTPSESHNIHQDCSVGGGLRCEYSYTQDRSSTMRLRG